MFSCIAVDVFRFCFRFPARGPVTRIAPEMLKGLLPENQRSRASIHRTTVPRDDCPVDGPSYVTLLSHDVLPTHVPSIDTLSRKQFYGKLPDSLHLTDAYVLPIG